MMDETMGQDEKERATKFKEDGHLNDIKKKLRIKKSSK